MTFIIATHNRKKLAELARILAPLGIDAVTAEDIGLTLPEVEETGATFADNARLKALSACRASGLPAVADDSGLAVDALNGAPGVFSARYGAPGAVTDADRNNALLAALNGVPEERRTARFQCAVCAVLPDGTEVTAAGACEGRIGFAPRGGGGFGYDPLFLLEDGRSFAELTAAEKDGISHRGRALSAFADRLRACLARNAAAENND